MAASSRGELAVVSNADDQTGLTVFRMTVTPAAAPSPAFKYRLLPSESEMLPGNAALHYCRAFAEGGVSGPWKAIVKEYGEEEVEGNDKKESWYSAQRPLSDIPLDKLRAAAARFDTIVDQCVDRGTFRQNCDWGHNLEDLKGLDVISFLLPEVQESRSLSRALMLRTRAAIADGDYDRAIKQLRMNYRLGQNTATDPILISALVGMAECGLGNYEMVELISSKDSPNMYWALAALPQPLIDVRPAVRYELNWAMKIFPVLGEAETAEHSPEEWARLLTQSAVDFQQVMPEMKPMNKVVARLGVTGMSLVMYPDARRRLIASGMDPKHVEDMPVGQVVAIDAAREYRRIANEFEKAYYVSYPDAKKYCDINNFTSGNKLSGGGGRVLAELLLPAVANVRNAQMRVDWQMGALQTLEAIRMHAAANGRLPATLDEIKIVPVPPNPVTDKPYEYKLNGDTAVLELPFSDGFPGIAWRFEVKLAK
jgi:hypothetical protein